jgi:hypothetical protein
LESRLARRPGTKTSFPAFGPGLHPHGYAILILRRPRVDLAATCFRIRGFQRATGHQLEDGVIAEGILVILVLEVGEDAVDAGADHVQESVVGLVGIAAVVEAAAKAWVKPMWASNWRSGRGPVSLVRADRDGSTRMDKPK